VPPVAVIFVKLPLAAVVAPITVPLIVPPVMAALLFSVLSLLRFVKLASTSANVSGEALLVLVIIVDMKASY
jgi:hypothetical protein